MQTNPSYNTALSSSTTSKPRAYVVSYTNPMFDNYSDIGGSSYKTNYDFDNMNVKVVRERGRGDSGFERGSYYLTDAGRYGTDAGRYGTDAGRYGTDTSRYGSDATKRRYQSSKHLFWFLSCPNF